MKKTASRIRLLFFLIAVFTVTFTYFQGQTIKIKQMNLKDFPRIEATVAVVNDWGVPISFDLSNVVLYENDRLVEEMTIAPLEQENIPLYTVIVLDKSGSMKGQAMVKAKEGAIGYVDLMKQSDQAAYIEFDTEVEVVCPFTADRAVLREAINKTRVRSDTALLDGINRGIELLRECEGRIVKTVLVLTDGRENRSSHSLDDVIKKASGDNISIYTIGLGDKIDASMLNDLAEKTEADCYFAASPADLIEIYRNVSRLLHSHYLLTFTTPFEMDGAWHRLKLEVPFQEGTIEGERPYFSAEWSQTPAEVLKKINEAEEARAKRAMEVAQPDEGEDSTAVILLGVTVLLLLFLLVLAWRKRMN